MKILQTNRLRKEYGKLVAVNDVDLSLEAGQVLGLIGPNGAGKTTLLRMLATLLDPTGGQIKVNDLDSKDNYLEIRKHIGYMPDFFNLYSDLKLFECLDFFARSYKVDPEIIPGRIDTILSLVDLQDKRNSYIKHLSRGMVQRMGLACLMVHDPDVYLLDEPASGLDPRARIILRDVLLGLSKQGKSIIISSHILTELSGFCTHVAMMNKGKVVVSGSVDEIEKGFAFRKDLSIKTLDDPEQVAILICQWDDVELLEKKDDNIKLRVVGGPERVAQLNADLVQNGIRIVSLYQNSCDLESLFMEVSENS